MNTIHTLLRPFKSDGATYLMMSQHDDMDVTGLLWVFLAAAILQYRKMTVAKSMKHIILELGLPEA
jgi:hypothetical protein